MRCQCGWEGMKPVSKFNLGFVLDESRTDGVECCRKLAVPIINLINHKNLKALICNGQFVTVLMYGSKATV